MLRQIYSLVLILTCLCLSGLAQPKQAFFVVHCDPGEPYNFPNLERLVDSANHYEFRLTIEFTAPWIDSILIMPQRLMKIKEWQNQGHEIGMHHHGLNAMGIWDGYTNYPKIEILNSGRDTSDLKGNMNALYQYIQQVSDMPIRTIGTEDSLEMPRLVSFQTTGQSVDHGYSNPFAYSHDGRDYCLTSHCFLPDLRKEELLELRYDQVDEFSILGANCHVHNFVDNHLPLIRYFQFVKQKGIESLTVSEILQGNCSGNFIENKDLASSLNIYPNPACNFLEIESSENISEIRVINIQGKDIYLIKVNSKNINLDTSHLHDGIYLIYVTGKNVQVKKIMISR